MKQLAIDNIDNIVILVLGLFAWFLERYKRKASEVAMTKDIVGMYRDALEDFRKKNDEKINLFEMKMKELEKEINIWKNKYQTLKREFDKYRRQHS